METVATITFGLLLWIVLWTLGVSGLDAIMIGAGFFLIAVAVQSLLPRVASIRRQ